MCCDLVLGERLMWLVQQMMVSLLSPEILVSPCRPRSAGAFQVVMASWRVEIVPSLIGCFSPSGQHGALVK